MKIGDYVRTNKGYIAKIVRFNSTGSITCDNKVYTGYNITNTSKILKNLSQITRSSPNIIDLIEVGDYVNGSKVIDIAQAPKKAIYLDTSGVNLIPVVNSEIHTIITKEQFESMSYKVGE